MFTTSSLRFRLLAAVNLAIAILLGLFLYVDYHRQVADGVVDKHIALEEETKTLLPAVARLAPYGEDAVQRYIDDVCGRMRDATSPGHHIAVQFDGKVLQSLAHHRASEGMVEAMEAAARSTSRRAPFGAEQLVVGSTRQGDTTVYVSEYVSSIRRAARMQVLQRLPRILLFIAVTAAVVNFVFLRMAARPLDRLVDTVRKIGDGKLGTQTGPLGSDELRYLASAVNSMSLTLAKEEKIRREEMERARRIQEQLLPKRIEVPGLEFAQLYLPAGDVAGDYYDVLTLPCGDCLACIADVTGHGVAAALSATMLKAYLLSAVDRFTDPGEILTFINHHLAVVCPTDNFATMSVATLDPTRTILRYASAGHENALLLNSRGCFSELPATGLVLGVMEDARYDTTEVEIGSGSRLLLVTDGVAEAMNAAGDLFGRRRVAELFQQCTAVSLRETLERINDAVEDFSSGRAHGDDITLLGFEVRSKTPAPRSECPSGGL